MLRSSLTSEECLELVREEILRVRMDRAPSAGELPQLSHQLSADLGLSSHDVVELVAALESRLALSDSQSLPVTDLTTVEDVCQVCLTYCRGDRDLTDAALSASQLRGQARRRP